MRTSPHLRAPAPAPAPAATPSPMLMPLLHADAAPGLVIGRPCAAAASTQTVGGRDAAGGGRLA
eukprot:1693443-Pleurochrysis_carterae.AAC.1